MKRNNRRRNIKTNKTKRAKGYNPLTHSGYNKGYLYNSKPLITVFGNSERYRTIKVEADATWLYKKLQSDGMYVLADPNKTSITPAYQNVENYPMTINDGDTIKELMNYGAIFEEYRISKIIVEWIPLATMTNQIAAGIQYMKYVPYGGQVPTGQNNLSPWIQNSDPIFMIKTGQHRNQIIVLPRPTAQFAGDTTLNNWKKTTDITSGLPIQVGTMYYQTDRYLQNDLNSSIQNFGAWRMQCRFVIQFRKEKFAGGTTLLEQARENRFYNKKNLRPNEPRKGAIDMAKSVGKAAGKIGLEVATNLMANSSNKSVQRIGKAIKKISDL